MNRPQTNSNVDWDAYLSVRVTTAAYTNKEFIRPYIKGKTLDVGCGYGDFTDWCRELTNDETNGIDPSQEAVTAAAKDFPSCRFSVGVAEKLPFPDNYFDTVISLEVVEHLDQPKVYFKEAYRVLKPNGIIISQTPNYPVKRFYDLILLLRGIRKGWADDPTHVSPFTFRKMKTQLSDTGFKVEKITGRNIMGENKIPFIKKIKYGPLAWLCSQKMISIARKPA